MVQLCIRTLLCLALLTGNTLHASVFTRPAGVEAGERVYLNPNTGRFWTMDTHQGSNRDPRSLHKYLYCSGNPINLFDPSGHDGEIEEEALAGSGAASLGAGSSFTVARLYVSVINTLIRVQLAQQQIAFYAQATALGFAALGEANSIMNRVIPRLQNNTTAIPNGNWSYGKTLEQIAIGQEQGYLGGNVKTFDLFDESTGIALSNKAHSLNNGPDLVQRWQNLMRVELETIKDTKASGFGGVTEAGKSISVSSTQIKQTVLLWEVPAAQADVVLSAEFQQVVAEFEELYETAIEVVPAAGFKGAP